jgi:ABC-2 type transport system ATP-binding protein
MSSGDVIEVENVRRHYGRPGRDGFEAVRGVTFSVRRGELFALLGTNGAGKTSTLELLEGLASPSSGTVRVLGHDPVRERGLVRSRTGVMLQKGGLPTGLTVAETARMWAGTMASPRPMEEVLALVDLSDRRGVAVRQLSGGEIRRLDLALAIMGRPEVLFLDEPTTGLDPESRSRTWGLVNDLLASGTTVLLTTHYLAEAEDLADRVAILHRGVIVSTGTPADVAASRPARISFTQAGHLPLPELAQLPGATGLDVSDGNEAVSSGHRVLVRTEDLQRTLSALMLWASSQGVVLRDLEARSGSLEEAFLAVASDPDAAHMGSKVQR